VADLELGERSEVLFPSPSFPPLPSPPLPPLLFLHPSPLPSLTLSSPLSPPLPFPPVLFLSLPLEVGPLNPARGRGSTVSSPGEVWGRVPAKIEFVVF